MNRRDFLAKTAATGLALNFSTFTSAAPLSKKPNILWIIAEDFCPDLGCYGEKVVKTPNIDKLASEGSRYTNAFTTAPVCSPSRSAFMTGMYQATIGAHQHRTPDKKPLPGPVKVITEYFRQAGYFTSSCSFNEKYDRPGKTDFNFIADKPFDGTDWRQRKPDQPFFSLVQFSETHRTFKRDNENPINPDDIILPPYYPDHPLIRRDWADYLECAQVMDTKVGKVLARFEEDDLVDNTIVFFFGDNGRPHIRGKQFLYEGGIHIPLIIRWPGNIKPNSVVDDLVSAIDFGPTSLALAEIKVPDHIQGRPFLGKNTIKRDYIVSARDRCDETYERIRCVRTKQFKYIRNFFPNLPYMQTNLYKLREYPAEILMPILYEEGKLTSEQEAFLKPVKPAEELYDLSMDPHELNNLAENPDYESKLSELRSILDKWITETGDKGQIPEDPNIAANTYREIHLPWHSRVMERRNLPPIPSPQQYLQYWQKQMLSEQN